ncbi:MAG: hypothetical protein ACRD34_00225 [Bryobacteraceae bacterium]
MGDTLYPSIGTVKDLEAWLNNLTPGNVDETSGLLQRLLDTASQDLQDAVGRIMLGVGKNPYPSYTEYRKLPASRTITLRQQPAQVLTSIALVPFGMDTIEFSPLIISATPNNAYVYLDDNKVYVPFTYSVRLKFQIIYTAGFTTTPADFYQAVIELAGLKYTERKRIGKKSDSIQGEAVVYDTLKWSESILGVVSRYTVRVYD